MRIRRVTYDLGNVIERQEGLKVNLCLEHHRNGPAAVHNNAKNARILMAKVINGEKYILVKADGDINANGIILENREGEKDEEEDD